MTCHVESNHGFHFRSISRVKMAVQTVFRVSASAMAAAQLQSEGSGLAALLTYGSEQT